MKIKFSKKISGINKTTLVRSFIDKKDQESKDKSFNDILEKEISKQKKKKVPKGR